MDLPTNIPSSAANNNFRKETKEEYWDRLNKSINDIENSKGIIFTMDELKEYVGLSHP